MILILGKKNCGKTTLIKNEILPNLVDYLIFDINNEYQEVEQFKKITFEKLSFDEIKKVVLSELDSAKNSGKTFIIEDIGKYSNSNKWTQNILEILSKGNISVVFTFQFIKNAEKIINELTDRIYLFKTTDNEKIRKKFINNNSDIIWFRN